MRRNKAELDLERILALPPCADSVRELVVPLGNRSYSIEFSTGGRRQVGKRVAQLFPGLHKAALITNPTVGALYFDDVAQSLDAEGIRVHRVDIPDSESAKNLDEVGRVLDELIVARFERKEPVIALGGGVVGDLAGFVASIYLRSVPFIQVPTTLLAQVDSSVGGKTGVNSPRGKNLIGSFFQPKHVLIDVETLQTLPDVEFRAGMAEVIKYGAIRDVQFFEYLEQRRDDVLAHDTAALEQVIYRSCANKAEVVAADERELGTRAHLNFGHTLGHAFETLGAYRGLRHGEAVAMGMVFATFLSCVRGHCDADRQERLTALLAGYGLPVKPAQCTPEACMKVMSVDKKVHQGKVRFVLLQDLGRAFLEPLAFDEIAPVLKDFLEVPA